MKTVNNLENVEGAPRQAKRYEDGEKMKISNLSPQGEDTRTSTLLAYGTWTRVDPTQSRLSSCPS